MIRERERDVLLLPRLPVLERPLMLVRTDEGDLWWRFTVVLPGRMLWEISVRNIKRWGAVFGGPPLPPTPWQWQGGRVPDKLVVPWCRGDQVGPGCTHLGSVTWSCTRRQGLDASWSAADCSAQISRGTAVKTEW